MKKIWIAFVALVCGIACAFSLAACNIGGEEPHTSHNWSSTYTDGGDRHYQTCDGCSEKKYSEHDYGTSGICVCGATKPIDGHTHNYQWVNNGDGTHKQHCSVSGCTEPDINSSNHDYGTNGICVCGATKPIDGHTHNYQWVDNGDGTHKQHCSVSGCNEPDINSGSHDYGAGGVCVCGATKPIDGHTHNYQWVDNGDGTHKQYCSVSGCDTPDINSGSHNYDTSGVCVCGAIKPADVHSHTWNSGEVTTPATCADFGVKTYTCSGCGETKTEQIEKLTTHTWNSGTVTAEPTCKDYGVKTYTCTVCGEAKTEQIDKLITHTYNDWTSNGNESHIHYCSVCNISETQNHIWGSGDVTKQPTCKDYGVKTYTCAVCGETKTEQVEKLTTHTWNSGTVTTQPTCKDYGIKTYTCTVCGETKTEQIEKLTTHTWNSGTVTTQPTCKDYGIKTYTCTVCGETKTEQVDKLITHTYNDWTSNGNENHIHYCSVCNISETQNHIWGSGDVTEQPTCKDYGVKTYTCTVCGETKTEQIEKLTTHTFTREQADTEYLKTAATCTDKAVYYVSCSVCYAKGTETFEYGEANGHSFGDWISDGDTTHSHTCSKCNKTESELHDLTVSACVCGKENSTEGLEFKLNSDQVSYTVYVGTAKDSAIIIIPSEYNGYPVTSIGYSAFENCTSLTGVTIGNSVTGIDYSAFYGCTSLTSITIPDSVTGIGGCAFANCTSLASVTIPDSVTSIGYSAFRYCTSLTSVTIPDSVTGIDQNAFANCTSLTSITIPDSVTSIGGWAFENCTSLTSVTIGNSVTSIDKYAFYGCTLLTSVAIPDSVISINDSAFRGCSGLTSVTIPDSVTSIGDYVFSDCSGLTNIMIPDNVTSIGRSAFFECTSLTSVTIPDRITSIAVWMFANCTSLTNITIPDNVMSIGEMAFYYCISLTTVYYVGAAEEWENISIGSNNECLLNANIIFMHTHVYSESVVEPTCTQQGYTLYVCECGKQYTGNYVPAIDHTEVTVAGVAATCTQTGLTEGKYCSVCKTVIVVQTEIPVKEHSVVIDKAVAATCTKTGLTEGSFCSVCRTVFAKQQTIEALGHNYENGKCTNCGRIEPNYWDGTVAEGFARGSGTQDDPYIIETAAQLAYLSSSASDGSNYSGKYIALICNIDLSGMEWTPIKSFAGNFDGNGYTISNFVITNASGYNGLFAYVLSDSSLKNINLEAFTIDVTYAGNIYAGGLVGSSSGIIDNCSANGSVSISIKDGNHYAYGGGLIGSQFGKTITNSYTVGTVYVYASYDTYAGGLVGNNSAAVSYCYSNCKVTATVVSMGFSSGARKCYIGGLIGYQDSKTISCSFATGNINMYSSALTNTRAGGLVGYNDGGTISNVYATGNVTATTDGTYTVSGGLVGDNNAGTISNGYALGTVKASSSTKSYEGGLLGYNDGYGKISNCFATGNTSNIGYMYYKSTATMCYNYYGKALPTKDFLISTLGWSEEIWTFVDDGYPILKNILC